jgi:hypothetical protein
MSILRRRKEWPLKKEEKNIINSVDVDDHLCLQLWSRGAVPRLIIFNKGRGNGRTVRFSWLEGENKSISLKKSDGKIEQYPIQDILPQIHELLRTEASYAPYKALLWKTALLFVEYLHEPKTVLSKEDLAMLPEEKREVLWLVNMINGVEKASFFPSFPLSEEEKVLIGEDLSIPVKDGERSVFGLRSLGITRRLTSCNPERWYRPLFFSAAALLLGFSLAEEDTQDVSDFFWQEVSEEGKVWDTLKQLPSAEGKIRKPLLHFQRKVRGYVRHWALLNDIEREESYDGENALLEQGFKRKKRMIFPEGVLGDVPYKVIFCELGEEDKLAVCLSPEQATLRHKGDRIYRLSTLSFSEAQERDSAGSVKDEFFTLGSLVKAVDFKWWLSDIRKILEPILSSPL